MRTEHGVVIRVEAGNRVWVETERHRACDGCGSQGFCAAGKDGKMQTRAMNLAGAKPGDRVVVEMAGNTIVGLSLLVYIVPVMALMAGAFAGDFFAAGTNVDAQVASALSALGALLLSILFIVVYGRTTGSRRRFLPKVTRIL